MERFPRDRDERLPEAQDTTPCPKLDNGRVQRGRANDSPLQKRQLAASVATHGSVSFVRASIGQCTTI